MSGGEADERGRDGYNTARCRRWVECGVLHYCTPSNNRDKWNLKNRGGIQVKDNPGEGNMFG